MARVGGGEILANQLVTEAGRRLLRIEQEAVAAYRKKLAERVRGLPHIYDPTVGHPDDDEDLRNEIDRRAVLRLIER